MNAHLKANNRLLDLSFKPIQLGLSKIRLSAFIPTSIRDAIVQPSVSQLRMVEQCPELLAFQMTCYPPIVVKQTARAGSFDIVGNFHSFSLIRAKLRPETQITAMYSLASADEIAELIRLEVLTNKIIPESLPATELSRMLQELFPNKEGENKQLLNRENFQRLFPKISSRKQLSFALNRANSQVTSSAKIREEQW